MYLVGAAHPNKPAAQRRLELLVNQGEHFATDAEVLQEILHRYYSINQPQAIQPAFDTILGVVDTIFPVELEDVQDAKSILMSTAGISARDAIHIAIMTRKGITTVLTFDRGFDNRSGITRLP
jgi:hypothetical protein